MDTSSKKMCGWHRSTQKDAAQHSVIRKRQSILITRQSSTTARTAKIKGWQARGAPGTLVGYWQDHRIIKPLWKILW